ncbi:endonuclease/exonuclease/phosphatase family protein [Haloferula sp.]|uniref:endonuclease/exonuclease/phosphatase family protein n=1 Tax=Haloferula sp. TaxID=2497595 RepID=UPI00329F8A3B
MQPALSLRSAPGILGAFVFPVILSLTGCSEESTAPPWEGDDLVTETSAKQAESNRDAGEANKAGDPAATTTEGQKPGTVRFVAYNLQNWLTMDRYVDRKPVGSSAKPESERDAIVALLKDAQPDILGICEIGTDDDLADLQRRLKSAGLDFPHVHRTGGVDNTRHLGLLSRFPITRTRIPDDLNYELEDRTRGMSRGILDATVNTPKGEIRFLGAHLKSKREIPDADQEMMRRAEAHLLRREADLILSEDPDTQLIVYGDMNDMRQSSAIRTIKGPRDGPTSLKMVWLKDSRGDTWTHHWSYQDVYSRFDYIFMSPPLLDDITWDECCVLDGDSWSEASDHRALLLVIE